MQLADAVPFLTEHQHGILATIKPDGRPHLTTITYGWNNGVIGISVTTSRVKTRNARRDARASLHVSEGAWSWVVVEADVELGPVAREPGDPGMTALRELYEGIAGPHPDWEDYDRAMIADERLVMTLRPVNVYGMGI
jgi:PPOX class probable F420-dependent enzyme